MTQIAPFFTETGDARVFAGEPLVVALQIRLDEDSDPLNLTGRSFALIAYRRSDRVAEASVQALADGDSVQLAFSGADTEGFYAIARSRGMRLQICELLEDGRSVLVDGALTVLAAPVFEAGESPDITAQAAPYCAVTVIPPANDLIVIATGAPGDMSSIGYPVGAVPAYAMLIALSDAGKLQDIRDNIPADINEEVAIRWTSGAPIKPDDAMATFIQTTLAYSDGQMTDLFTAAVAAI